MLERDKAKESASPSRIFQQQPVAVGQSQPPVDPTKQNQSGTEGYGFGEGTNPHPSDPPMAVVTTQKTAPVETRQPQALDASSSGLIMPGDLLSIRVKKISDLPIEKQVSNAGEIVMPIAGTVQVAGLTPRQAMQHIARLLAAHRLVNPRVDLSVKR